MYSPGGQSCVLCFQVKLCHTLAVFKAEKSFRNGFETEVKNNNCLIIIFLFRNPYRSQHQVKLRGDLGATHIKKFFLVVGPLRVYGG